MSHYSKQETDSWMKLLTGIFERERIRFDKDTEARTSSSRKRLRVGITFGIVALVLILSLYVGLPYLVRGVMRSAIQEVSDVASKVASVSKDAAATQSSMLAATSELRATLADALGKLSAAPANAEDLRQKLTQVIQRQNKLTQSIETFSSDIANQIATALNEEPDTKFDRNRVDYIATLAKVAPAAQGTAPTADGVAPEAQGAPSAVWKFVDTDRQATIGAIRGGGQQVVLPIKSGATVPSGAIASLMADVKAMTLASWADRTSQSLAKAAQNIQTRIEGVRTTASEVIKSVDTITKSSDGKQTVDAAEITKWASGFSVPLKQASSALDTTLDEHLKSLSSSVTELDGQLKEIAKLNDRLLSVGGIGTGPVAITVLAIAAMLATFGISALWRWSRASEDDQLLQDRYFAAELLAIEAVILSSRKGEKEASSVTDSPQILAAIERSILGIRQPKDASIPAPLPSMSAARELIEVLKLSKPGDSSTKS